MNNLKKSNIGTERRNHIQIQGNTDVQRLQLSAPLHVACDDHYSQTFDFNPLTFKISALSIRIYA